MLKFANIYKTPNESIHYYSFINNKDAQKVNELALRNIIQDPLFLMKKVILNSCSFYFPSLRTLLFNGKDVLKYENTYLSLMFLLLWIFIVFNLAKKINKRKSIRTEIILFTLIATYIAAYTPFLVFIGHWLYAMGTYPFLIMLYIHSTSWKKS